MLVLEEGRGERVVEAPPRLPPRVRALPWVLLLLAVPSASAAGEAVRIVDVALPDRTMAERAWAADVTLESRLDEPQTVVLLGALYADETETCGTAAGPRFRQFTHLVQERIALAPRETRIVEDWRQMYARASAPGPAPATAQWCVFVAEDGGQAIEYLDLAARPLSIRAVNAPPEGVFTWNPIQPVVAQDVTFTAGGTDADGDPLAYRWDFGHADAGGRAVGEGQVVTESFYPTGAFPVTLYASDGLEETASRQVIEVVDAPPPPRETPLPLVTPVAALLWAALRQRPPPRCR